MVGSTTPSWNSRFKINHTNLTLLVFFSGPVVYSPLANVIFKTNRGFLSELKQLPKFLNEFIVSRISLIVSILLSNAASFLSSTQILFFPNSFSTFIFRILSQFHLQSTEAVQPIQPPVLYRLQTTFDSETARCLLTFRVTETYIRSPS